MLSGPSNGSPGRSGPPWRTELTGRGKKPRLGPPAEWDLEHARSDLELGYYDWASFSAQQAAEEAAKAVFQKLGADVWGHSVADLLAELGKRIPVPEELMEGALELDKVYILARYPMRTPRERPGTGTPGGRPND